MRDPTRFAAFILSHGRPDNVITFRTLRRSGYSGRIYLVVDDEDERRDEYRERFGAENVLEFSKSAIATTFDPADTSSDRRTVAYARNASFGLARDLGLDYFLELDDDYLSFLYRYTGRTSPGSRGGHAGATSIRNFDDVVRAMLRLLEDTNAVAVAMAQGGDHIGGVGSATLRHGFKRKAMNAIFLRTDRPVTFPGRLNEDVNAYALGGSRGDLFLSVSALQLNQVETQRSVGGMTEAYLSSGTYVKSFYTVMMCPSFVSIAPMGRFDRRLHHRIDWEHAVPKIVGPEYRREAAL